jgi:hypothetical protein
MSATVISLSAYRQVHRRRHALHQLKLRPARAERSQGACRAGSNFSHFALVLAPEHPRKSKLELLESTAGFKPSRWSSGFVIATVIALMWIAVWLGI